MNENNISLLYITYFLFLFIPPPSPEWEWRLLKYLPGVNATRNILLTNTSHTVYSFLHPVHPTPPPFTYSHPTWKTFSFSANPLQSYIQLTSIYNTTKHKLLSVYVFVSYISFVRFNFYSGHGKVYIYRLRIFPLDHIKAGINMKKI
jgi:hypothetical protein